MKVLKSKAKEEEEEV